MERKASGVFTEGGPGVLDLSRSSVLIPIQKIQNTKIVFFILKYGLLPRVWRSAASLDPLP